MGLFVNSIHPEAKDYMRAKNLAQRGIIKINMDSNKMARAITDIQKLVRRAKAVAEIWSTEEGGRYFEMAFSPFEERLKDFNFTEDEISTIRGKAGKPRKQVNAINTDKEINKDLEDLWGNR
jgi:hypothetical protein